MNDSSRFLGIVENKQFHLLDPPETGEAQRFTSISIQEGTSPESGELDLTEYEGSAILIRGRRGDVWIYSSEVVDQATPIVTELVRRMFGASPSGSR